MEQVGKLTVHNGLIKIPFSLSSFQNCILIQDNITLTVFTFDIAFPVKHQLSCTQVVFNIALDIYYTPSLLESQSSFHQRIITIIHNGSCIDPPLHARENAQR